MLFTSIQWRGAPLPFFFFSFKPRGTFLRLRAENTTCLLRFCFMCVPAHTPFFFAVFAHNLACQVSFPLTVQPGFPSHFALNKRKGSFYPPLNPDFFLPSILSFSSFSWSFPSGLAAVLRNRKCSKDQSRALLFMFTPLLICLPHFLPLQLHLPALIS